MLSSSTISHTQLWQPLISDTQTATFLGCEGYQSNPHLASRLIWHDGGVGNCSGTTCSGEIGWKQDGQSDRFPFEEYAVVFISWLNILERWRRMRRWHLQLYASCFVLFTVFTQRPASDPPTTPDCCQYEGTKHSPSIGENRLTPTQFIPASTPCFYSSNRSV